MADLVEHVVQFRRRALPLANGIAEPKIVLLDARRVGLNEHTEPSECRILLVVVFNLPQGGTPEDSHVSIKNAVGSRRTYHCFAKCSRCGAIGAGQTRPILPIVTAAFSLRLRGLLELHRIGTSLSMIGATNGCSGVAGRDVSAPFLEFPSFLD